METETPSVRDDPRLHYWARRMVADPLGETRKVLDTIDLLKAQIAELENRLNTAKCENGACVTSNRQS